MLSTIVRAAQEFYGRKVSHQEAAEYAWNNIRMKVKSDSWRVYKSRHLASTETIEERELVANIYSELKSKNSDKTRRKRTKSRRRKSLSSSEYNEIMQELMRPVIADEHTRKITRMWVTATLYTGLRPSEWRETTVINLGGDEYLKVRNSKVVEWEFKSEDLARQGRIRASFRIIPIAHLPEREIQVIKALSNLAREASSSGDFTGVYDRVRLALSRSVRNLWPAQEKRPTLYTARHAFRDSFEARMRQSGHSTVETELLVSVVLGHGSTTTKYAYGVADEEPILAERAIAVDGLERQKNVLMSWSLSQLE